MVAYERCRRQTDGASQTFLLDFDGKPCCILTCMSNLDFIA
jgi:hypothetical protein